MGKRHLSDLPDAGVLALALLLPPAAAWLYFVTFADSAFMPVVYAACKGVQFSLPAVWVFLFRPGSRIVGRGSAPSLWAGFLTGGGMVAVMLAIHFALIGGSGLASEAGPRVAARITAIGAASPVRYVGLALLISLGHSFLEEYYWRWFVFDGLRKRTSGVIGGIVSSIAFSAHHVIVLHAFIGPGDYWWMTLLLSLGVASAGGLWAWLYSRSGGLLSPWISHALIDLGIFIIGFDLSRSYL